MKIESGDHAQAQADSICARAFSQREHEVFGKVDMLPVAEIAARRGLSCAAAERRWARAIMLMIERLAKT